MMTAAQDFKGCQCKDSPRTSGLILPDSTSTPSFLPFSSISDAKTRILVLRNGYSNALEHVVIFLLIIANK